MKGKLHQLLAERARRQAGKPRALVATEDLVRSYQGWRKPWYHVKSSENGYNTKEGR